MVDFLHILESSYEGTNVLESCASHNFRGWVFQEPIIDICELLALFIKRTNCSYFSDYFCASFADFFVLILGQVVIKREHSVSEVIEADDFGDVQKILSDGHSDNT